MAKQLGKSSNLVKSSNLIIPGFSNSIHTIEKPNIAVFAKAFGGKTRFCATAGAWAADRGKVPGWLIMDRKTRQTIKETCKSLGLPIPYYNEQDFISSSDAVKLARLDGTKAEDEPKVKEAYSAAIDKVMELGMRLVEQSRIEPIIIDSGTELWDYCGYSRLGRREGKLGRYWGPAKRDWKDFFDALKSKTVLVTLWARYEWKKDASGNEKQSDTLLPDGPPNLDYTVTTLVRLRFDEKKKDVEDKYKLDIVDSIDNNAISGVDGVLSGEDITFEGLMELLNVEEAE